MNLASRLAQLENWFWTLRGGGGLPTITITSESNANPTAFLPTVTFDTAPHTLPPGASRWKVTANMTVNVQGQGGGVAFQITRDGGPLQPASFGYAEDTGANGVGPFPTFGAQPQPVQGSTLSR